MDLDDKTIAALAKLPLHAAVAASAAIRAGARVRADGRFITSLVELARVPVDHAETLRAAGFLRLRFRAKNKMRRYHIRWVFGGSYCGIPLLTPDEVRLVRSRIGLQPVNKTIRLW